MAPIAFAPHSCRHCQRFVIGEDDHKRSDNGQEKLFQPLHYTLSQILTAASEDCSFCAWLLDDEEWIHRSAITDMAYASPRIGHREGLTQQLEELYNSLVEAAVRMDNLPPPNPANTLRSYCPEIQNGQSNSLTLACFYNDHLAIKFFALWDPEAKHIVYRTRTGFVYFTRPGRSAILYSFQGTKFLRSSSHSNQ
jgi:hypothetical protein